MSKTIYTRKNFEEDTGVTLQVGERIKVMQRGVSSSGMRRYLDLYVIRKGDLQRITYNVAKLCELTMNKKHDCLQIDGCGMDMHFATVYSLSCSYFGQRDKEGKEASKTGYITERDKVEATSNKTSESTGYFLKYDTI